jgi:hypothetical protein
MNSKINPRGADFSKKSMAMTRSEAINIAREIVNELAFIESCIDQAIAHCKVATTLDRLAA